MTRVVLIGGAEDGREFEVPPEMIGRGIRTAALATPPALTMGPDDIESATDVITETVWYRARYTLGVPTIDNEGRVRMFREDQ